MPYFNAQQRKLRKTDEVKVARQFTTSPFIYGADSKQRQPNPDFHPPICQREDGKFVDPEGRLLPDSKVPDYVRAQGRPPKAAEPFEPSEVDLAEAMTESARPADPVPVSTRKPAAKRGRK